MDVCGIYKMMGAKKGEHGLEYPLDMTLKSVPLDIKDKYWFALESSLNDDERACCGWCNGKEKLILLLEIPDGWIWPAVHRIFHASSESECLEKYSNYAKTSGADLANGRPYPDPFDSETSDEELISSSSSSSSSSSVSSSCSGCSCEICNKCGKPNSKHPGWKPFCFY